MGICTKQSCTLALASVKLGSRTWHQPINYYWSWELSYLRPGYFCFMLADFWAVPSSERHPWQHVKQRNSYSGVSQVFSSWRWMVLVRTASTAPELTGLLYRLQNWHFCTVCCCCKCSPCASGTNFYHTIVWRKIWGTVLVQVPWSGCSWV